MSAYKNLKIIESENFSYIFCTKDKELYLASKEMLSLLKFINNNLNLQSISKEVLKDFSRLNKFEIDDVLYAFSKLKLITSEKSSQINNNNSCIKRNVNKEHIIKNIANTKQIVVQVTNKCNLKCAYCVDGKSYRDLLEKDRIFLSEKVCEKFIKSVIELHNTTLNESSSEVVFIGFYGGEPLLNFKLIERIVELTQKMQTNFLKIRYSMTTNGTLLDRYIDFLVKQNFILNISLDGSENDNSFRVFSNGKKTFNSVCKNINLIRYTYPTYYESNVSFISVLHKFNTINSINNFFQGSLKKKPTIIPLSRIEVNSDSSEALFNNHFSSEIDHNLIFCNEISNINDLFFQNSNRGIHSGTCDPFSNKIYLDCNGHIYPCERVDSKFIFGYCDQTHF